MSALSPDTSTAPDPAPPAPRPRASTALLVLATLAVGATLWAAQDVILPVLLAMFFALVGNPIIRLLQKLRLPRFLAALLVLALGLASAGALAVQLAGPAADWFAETPQQLREGRGYAIVGIFVLAAVLTPPDVVSQLMLAIPMCVLYELGIHASRWLQPRRQPASEP